MSKKRIINLTFAAIITIALVILTIVTWRSQGDVHPMAIAAACFFYPVYIGVLWNVVDEYIKMREEEA